MQLPTADMSISLPGNEPGANLGALQMAAVDRSAAPARNIYARAFAG
jgi:hypothetical protein